MKNAIESAREDLDRKVKQLELICSISALLPENLTFEPRNIIEGAKEYKAVVIFEVNSLEEVKELYTTLTPERVEGDKAVYGPVSLMVDKLCPYSIGTRFVWYYRGFNNTLLCVWCSVKGYNNYAYSFGRMARVYYYSPKLVTKFEKYGMNESIKEVSYGSYDSYGDKYKTLPRYHVYWEYNTLPIK